MRYILDPADNWLAQPPLAQSQSNKRPVTVNDALSVEIDSGPVNVDVLANDFDPEGGPLTLVSAFAALGSAIVEVDDTVTYTPPPGISGFDTVVYTAADDQGQTRDGQIDVTITEPQLVITTQPDNTFVVTAETGLLDVTVTQPAVFAGTSQFDTADIVSGPAVLVAPVISGTVDTGQVLTASEGLWVYDPAAGLPVQSWQWRRSGFDIPGATSKSYTVQAADLGQPIEVRETQTNGFGQRSSLSASVGGSGAAFSPIADPGLVAWYDAADAGSIAETEGQVSIWNDKSGTANLVQSVSNRQPQTGGRQQNGLNVLDFDGGDYLDTPLSLPASANAAIHAALVIDTVSNAFEALVSLEATNDMQLDAASNTQFDGRLNTAGIGAPVTLAGGPFSGPLIISILFDFTGAGTVEVYVNGVLRASTDYTTALDTVTTLHLMTNRSRNASSDGAVCELVITEDVTNRADHHGYLSGKWGIL